MSLRDDLAKRRENSRALTPPEALAVMDKATDELLRSGIVEQSLKVGDFAPAFVLPNALGKEISLAGLIARGPVVLSFYRGGW